MDKSPVLNKRNTLFVGIDVGSRNFAVVIISLDPETDDVKYIDSKICDAGKDYSNELPWVIAQEIIRQFHETSTFMNDKGVNYYVGIERQFKEPHVSIENVVSYHLDTQLNVKQVDNISVRTMMKAFDLPTSANTNQRKKYRIDKVKEICEMLHQSLSTKHPKRHLNHLCDAALYALYLIKK